MIYKRTAYIVLSILFCFVVVIMMINAPRATAASTVLSPPAVDNRKTTGSLQTAVFAGGCFWGTQGVFEHVRGVRKVVSGYVGGDKASATYPAVSSGGSNHAESIQITYDPAQVSYGELLHVFFSVAHDPTQLNRQGPDRGTQYRSAIFYTDDAQKNLAQTYIAQINKSGAFKRDIVTTVGPLQEFFVAEEYHQDFLIKNPNYPYIVIHDLPKIGNLKKLFPALYANEAASLAKAQQLKL